MVKELRRLVVPLRRHPAQGPARPGPAPGGVVNLADRLAAAQGRPAPDRRAVGAVRRPGARGRRPPSPAPPAADRRPRPAQGPRGQGAVRAHGRPAQRPEPVGRSSCARSSSASSTRSSRRRRSRSAPRSGPGSPPSSPTTCSASARCSGCSTTTRVSEIMVNGPDNIYVERRGKLEPAPALLHLRGAPAAGHRPHRLPGRTAHRRVLARWSTRAWPTAPASTRSSRRWPSAGRR